MKECEIYIFFQTKTNFRLFVCCNVWREGFKINRVRISTVVVLFFCLHISFVLAVTREALYAYDNMVDLPIYLLPSIDQVPIKTHFKQIKINLWSFSNKLKQISRLNYLPLRNSSISASAVARIKVRKHIIDWVVHIVSSSFRRRALTVNLKVERCRRRQRTQRSGLRQCRRQPNCRTLLSICWELSQLWWRTRIQLLLS